MMFRARHAVAVLLLTMACGSDGPTSSIPQAAWMGIDTGIDRAITLAFQGFNAATTGTIPRQTANGTASGTLTVTGQVDQGSSVNKSMQLLAALTNYMDNVSITYSTGAGAPLALNKQLTNIPTGNFTGTVVGVVAMGQSQTGNLTLNLAFSGNLQVGTGGSVQRVAGATHNTGSATTSAGTHNVNVMR